MCEYRSDNLTLKAPTAGTQDRYDIDMFKETSSSSDIFAVIVVRKHVFIDYLLQISGKVIIHLLF